jgi:hypothetical protein
MPIQDASILSRCIGDDFIGCFETNHRPQALEQFFAYLESNGPVVERPAFSMSA